MPGQAIGTSMLYGYPGTVSRTPDSIIMNRPVKDTDETGPAFGEPVVLNTDNTYSRFGATGAMATFGGVAIREVKQTADYYSAEGQYQPGEACDVIQRGSVMVLCNIGTPTAGGEAYIRTELGSNPLGVVGQFEAAAAADGGTTVEITNCRWKTGLKDANNVAELEILTKNLP
ncbi:MAG TPA: hypothetical protein DCZ10_16140 [Pelotomaculum sp.]|nr:hypothetical protein [Pelotomaculum sp.]